ncbi:helicase HerA domain-containing protein [Methanosphaera sp.]
MAEIIGRCIGETSPMSVGFVSKKTPEVGEYVYLEYNDKIVLGMIDSLLRGSTTLDESIRNPETIAKILNIEGDLDHYIRGTITILGDKDELKIPRTPAPPGTEVKKADKELLQEIFQQNDGIEIGSVLTEPDVPIKLNVNKMVSRHLAILAMTGAGKSNTTSVILDELLAKNGTIIVFDMHSEYGNIEFKNGEKKRFTAQINPRDLKIHEYKKLASITDSAVNQEKYLRDAYDYANDLINNNDAPENANFIDLMIKNLNSTLLDMQNEDKKNKHEETVQQVIFKLEDMKRKYAKLLESVDTSDIVDSLARGKVNIVSLGSVDERATDIIVNHTLTNILNRRKNTRTGTGGKQLEYPIFCVIEEAHILASEGRNTQSKGIIGRIAREGRKFGVGLCLISQSPKSLDSGALSQVNNMIILRLVEPGDQSHVQRSSESLSEDLLKQLPSLNVGEAVVLGQMTKIPTMVKVKEFEGTSIGSDIDILKEWEKAKRQEELEREEQEEDIDDMGI